MALCIRCKKPCLLFPACPEHAEEVLAEFEAYDNSRQCWCACRKDQHEGGTGPCPDPYCKCTGFRQVSEELQGCIQNFSMVKKELEGIETQLSERLGIPMPCRNELVRRARAHVLEEDELVRDWHERLSSYLNYDELAEPLEPA